MFKIKDKCKPFESKIWLASPTMHGEELKYVIAELKKQYVEHAKSPR